MKGTLLHPSSKTHKRKNSKFKKLYKTKSLNIKQNYKQQFQLSHYIHKKVFNDYSKILIQSILFLTLFPYGYREITNNNHIYKVYPPLSTHHLLKYAIKKKIMGTIWILFNIHSRNIHVGVTDNHIR